MAAVEAKEETRVAMTPVSTSDPTETETISPEFGKPHGRTTMSRICLDGVFLRKEWPKEARKAFEESKDAESEREWCFLGPEYHHIFAISQRDKAPEFEEAWTDTFYDLFLVAMMSKVTRMILQDVLENEPTSNTGNPDFQDFWHISAVIAFCVSFYALWRSMLMAQMHIRSNERQDWTTRAFVLTQLLCVLFMCLGVFHKSINCNFEEEAEHEEEEEEAEHHGRSLEEAQVEHIEGGGEENEEGCVVFGHPFFGAALMWAHIMLGMWHVYGAFHWNPIFAIEDDECFGEMEPEEKSKVARIIQKLTKRSQLTYVFKSLFWAIAGFIHWTTIASNDAKGIACCYIICYAVCSAYELLNMKFGNLGEEYKVLRRRLTNPNTGKMEWCSVKFLEEELEKGANYRIPIHVPFYMGRHKAFAAIAFGESILQLTGANNNESWDNNSHQMTAGVFGLIVIFCLASLYFNSFNGNMHDHPIRTSHSGAHIWSDLQLVVIVSLVFLGAGFEATWHMSSSSDMLAKGLHAPECGDGDHDCHPAMRLFVVGAFLNAFSSCAMNMLGQNMQRGFAWFPCVSMLVYLIIPGVTCVLIITPMSSQDFQDGTAMDIDKAIILVAFLLFVQFIYHINAMGFLFYKLADFKAIDDSDTQENLSHDLLYLNFEKENLIKAQKELEEKMEENEKEIERIGVSAAALGIKSLALTKHARMTSRGPH